MRVTGLALALASILPATAGAQNPGDPPPAYLIEYSTAPMVRNAALAEIITRSIERGADWVADGVAGDLFTRKSTGGFFARLGRGITFDHLIESYCLALAHEYGHATRAEESGRSAEVFLGPFSRKFFRMYGAPLAPLWTISVFGGGLEGQYVLAERVEDRIYARGTATAGDVRVLLWSAFSSESYILKTLSEGRLASPEQLLNGGRPGMPGDPVYYVLALSAERLSHPAFTQDEVTHYFADIQANARSVRRRSAINFLDYGTCDDGDRTDSRLPVERRASGSGAMAFARSRGARAEPELSPVADRPRGADKSALSGKGRDWRCIRPLDRAAGAREPAARRRRRRVPTAANSGLCATDRLRPLAQSGWNDRRARRALGYVQSIAERPPGVLGRRRREESRLRSCVPDDVRPVFHHRRRSSLLSNPAETCREKMKLSH